MIAPAGTISIAKACDLARISRRTLYNWMERGAVTFVRTAGGSARIVAASLFRDGNVTAASALTPALQTASVSATTTPALPGAAVAAKMTTGARLRCPECHAPTVVGESFVLDDQNVVLRTRSCESCRTKVRTYEVIEGTPIDWQSED